MKKIIILLLTSFFIVVGCDSDSTAKVKIDVEKSKIKTEAASASFTETLIIVKEKMDSTSGINDASDMDDMDFTAAYVLYNEAVEANPNNLDAELGAAISRILSLLKDPEFIKLRNAWWNVDNDFSLDSASLTESRMKLTTFINDSLLPSIDYSLERLAIIDTDVNKDYVYLVTPEFYSEEEGDTFELDMTEIKLFHASLIAAKAFINLSQAYKLDLGDYSLEGIKNALSKGSNFLTLLDSSKTVDAYNQAKVAIDKAIEGINFLLVENDDQDDDILRNSSDNAEEIHEFKDNLLEIRKYLTQPYEFKNNAITLTVNISNLLNNPPEDLKELLPNYTVSIEGDKLKVEPEAEDKVSLIFPDTSFGGLFDETSSQEDIKVFLDIYECTATISCYDGNPNYHCNDNFNCEYGKTCSDDTSCDSWSHCSEEGYCDYGTRCVDNTECSDWEHCSDENICEDGAICTTSDDCSYDDICNSEGYCEWTKK